MANKNSKTVAAAAGKRGRKPIQISFNFAGNRPFTVEQVHARASKSKTISRVAVSVKLKKLVASGLVKRGAKVDSGKRGRPFFTYTLTAKGLRVLGGKAAAKRAPRPRTVTPEVIASTVEATTEATTAA